MQLVAPVRMLAILDSEPFAQLRTQSRVQALVRTDFAAQRLQRMVCGTPLGDFPDSDSDIQRLAVTEQILPRTLAHISRR